MAEQKIAQKNYQSDFDAIINIKTCNDKDLGFPTYDWEAIFYTSASASTYNASSIKGVTTNCFDDNGKIHVVFNNHGLQSGDLMVKFISHLPNGIYPDKDEIIVSPQKTGIKLVRGAGCYGTIEDIQLVMPYIKGDKGDAFTFDDFTEAQINQLQKPATDAAKAAEAAITKVEATNTNVTNAETQRAAAETERVAAENSRQSAEQTRIANENTRKSNEIARQYKETTRQNNENQRETNEIARQQAEQTRVATFAGFQTEIDSKQPALTTSTDVTVNSDATLSLTERAKMRYFIDRWNEAWKIDGVQYGKYDPDNAPDAGHPFQGNGLWMTYEEAIPILELAPFCKLEFGDDSFKNRFRFMGNRGTYSPRTLVPFMLTAVNARVGSADGMFQQWVYTNLEVLVFLDSTPPRGVRVQFTSYKNTFEGCNKLHTIKGLSLRAVGDSNNTVKMFERCAKLQNLTASFLNCDVSLKDSPLLTRESIGYLVQYASNTAPITVTVHPDVYAKLTGDTTNAAAAALSTEEAAQWQQVVTDAAAKNISFATV